MWAIEVIYHQGAVMNTYLQKGTCNYLCDPYNKNQQDALCPPPHPTPVALRPNAGHVLLILEVS